MTQKNDILLSALRRLNGLRLFFGKFRKTRLALIEDKQLTTLLQQNGQWDDFVEGSLRCSQCGKAITSANLSGFIVANGKYHFLCDSQFCLTPGDGS